MKIALAVNIVTKNIQNNIEMIKNYIKQSKLNGAELIIFPETSITGFNITGNPEKDYRIAFSNDSTIISDISNCAKLNNISVSIAFIENDNFSLYDSVILINNNGQIITKYRRMSKGWHNPNDNSSIYQNGKKIIKFNINSIKFSFLLCGDLFCDELIEEVKTKYTDFVIIPFARSSEKEMTQLIWNTEELPFYIEQCKKLNATCLLTNYVSYKNNEELNFFGGAYVINKFGIVEVEMPIGKNGIIYYDYKN